MPLIPIPHTTREERMALERTLSIIKPDAVAKNVIGQICTRFEQAGLKIIAAKMKRLSRDEAEGFYAVHRERPFFGPLVEFMTSGPVLVQVLEGENAIARNRELMGATNPREAAPGTIRADFAQSIDANAVHGSDGPDTARFRSERDRQESRADGRHQSQGSGARDDPRGFRAEHRRQCGARFRRPGYRAFRDRLFLRGDGAVSEIGFAFVHPQQGT